MAQPLKDRLTTKKSTIRVWHLRQRWCKPLIPAFRRQNWKISLSLSQPVLHSFQGLHGEIPSQVKERKKASKQGRKKLFAPSNKLMLLTDMKDKCPLCPLTPSCPWILQPQTVSPRFRPQRAVGRAHGHDTH